MDYRNEIARDMPGAGRQRCPNPGVKLPWWLPCSHIVLLQQTHCRAPGVLHPRAGSAHPRLPSTAPSENHVSAVRDIAAARPHLARTTLPCARSSNRNHRARPERVNNAARDGAQLRDACHQSSAQLRAAADRKANANVFACVQRARGGDCEPVWIRIAAYLFENDSARSPQLPRVQCLNRE